MQQTKTDLVLHIWRHLNIIPKTAVTRLVRTGLEYSCSFQFFVLLYLFSFQSSYVFGSQAKVRMICVVQVRECAHPPDCRTCRNITFPLAYVHRGRGGFSLHASHCVNNVIETTRTSTKKQTNIYIDVGMLCHSRELTSLYLHSAGSAPAPAALDGVVANRAFSVARRKFASSSSGSIGGNKNVLAQLRDGLAATP